MHVDLQPLVLIALSGQTIVTRDDPATPAPGRTVMLAAPEPESNCSDRCRYNLEHEAGGGGTMASPTRRS
jgi:hypothetical protein